MNGFNQGLVFGFAPFTGRDTSQEHEYQYESPDHIQKQDLHPYEYTSEENAEYKNHAPKPKDGSIFKRLHQDHALHPLTHDETITYTSMLSRDEDAEVFVMPNHRIDENGNIKGFRLVVNRDSDCVHLPITREMFMGTTCVECDPGDRDIHPDVIRLLNNPDDVKENILKMLADIAGHKPEEMVSLDHMPVYGDSESVAVSVDDNCTGRERCEILLENLIADRIGHHSTTMRGRDSRPWKCDMPMSVGVYHAHVRSRDSGRRHHKIFITVSGGCRRASEQFYNMNLDLLGNARAIELESCEEAWWLRRTSTRSRCRTIKMVASALQLSVPVAGDVFDFEDNTSLPIHTTDTLDHNISETDDGRIALFNECCDSTSTANGILCKQHPTEGIWIFQGSQQSAVGTLSNFGGVFGHQDTCGAFPTGTFCLYEDSYQQQSHPTYIQQQKSHETLQYDSNQRNTGNNLGSLQMRDTRLNLYKEKESNTVIYYNPLTGKETSVDFESRPHFVKMDESFLKHLESHAWMREYQIIQLIPIINAVQTVRVFHQAGA
jgi:hypothetical protein